MKCFNSNVVILVAVLTKGELTTESYLLSRKFEERVTGERNRFSLKQKKKNRALYCNVNVDLRKKN